MRSAASHRTRNGQHGGVPEAGRLRVALGIEGRDSPVDYAQTSEQEYVANAVQGGVPEHLGRRFLGFSCDMRDNQLDETSSDLKTLLGRPPATLGEGPREVFTL